MLTFFSALFHPIVAFLTLTVYYPLLNVLHAIVAIVPGHNAFWGIVGLTLLVRVALLLPSARSARSQKQLASLQPKLSELKAEYGSDRNGYAAAQMELYKENGISPFASCLPILITLPFLVVLYQVVLHGLGPNAVGLYSWIPKPSFIRTVFLGLDLLKPDHTFILPIIAAVLQFFQAKMVMPPLPPKIDGQEPDAAMMAQRQTMYIAPATYLLIGFSIPAGAVIYVIVGSIFTIVQQYYINKERTPLVGVV